MNNFSERIKKSFSINKIVCNIQDEVRNAVDKIIRSNDWSTELVCNFKDASNLFDSKDYNDLSKLKLDTSKVTDMSWMFYNCSSLTSIPQLNTSKVTNMSFMFCKCVSLTNIPQLDTSNVINMYCMFEECLELISIPQLDTTKVTDIRHITYACSSLYKLGYPVKDNNKMKEIISTTGIDGKPYKS